MYFIKIQIHQSILKIYVLKPGKKNFRDLWEKFIKYENNFRRISRLIC